MRTHARETTSKAKQMTIEYTLYTDDDASKEVIFSTSIGNTDHANWQAAVGLYRSTARLSNGMERRAYHTTIHDTERLSFEVDYLDTFFTHHAEKDYPALSEIYAKAIEVGCEYVFV